jgi:hypothetical protein
MKMLFFVLTNAQSFLKWKMNLSKTVSKHHPKNKQETPQPPDENLSPAAPMPIVPSQLAASPDPRPSHPLFSCTKRNFSFFCSLDCG